MVPILLLRMIFTLLCEYGCGNEAKFVLKNGKQCCSNSCNKCPEIRRKNSLGISKAHKEGRLSTKQFSRDGARNWAKGKIFFKDEQFDEYFCINSSYCTGTIKKIIRYKKYIEYKCDICGNSGIWNGKELILQLDHINGNNKDQSLSNLRFLCPNCHTQTDNFCGKNINRKGNFVNEIDNDKLVECLKNFPKISLAIEYYNRTYNKNLKVHGRLYDYIKKLLLKTNSFIGQNILDSNELKKIINEKNKIHIKKELEKADKLAKIVSMVQDIAIKINNLIDASIDFSKYGWVNEASKIINVSPQKTRKWIEKNCSELLINAYKRG